MKYAINCLLGLAVFASIVPRAMAQGCRLDMTPYYNVYATESTDGTNVYTSVLTDGYANFQPSAGCNGQGVTHQPRSYNLISTTGGWGYGTPACISCYLSYENNQQVPLNADGGYGDYPPFVWEGEVFCSVAGDFFDQYSGTPPNNCDFTIVPDYLDAAYCDGIRHSTGVYQAQVVPSLGQCGFVPSSSTCSWRVVSGDISDISNTNNMNSLSASCEADYIAGNLNGQTAGVVEWTMTLQLSAATITHTQEATVYCPQ